MKNYFMEFFDIEAGEFTLKEVLIAGVSLLAALSIVVIPLAI